MFSIIKTTCHMKEPHSYLKGQGHLQFQCLFACLGVNDFKLIWHKCLLERTIPLSQKSGCIFSFIVDMLNLIIHFHSAILLLWVCKGLKGHLEKSLKTEFVLKSSWKQAICLEKYTWIRLFVSPEKATYRDYFRRQWRRRCRQCHRCRCPDFFIRSITLSL